jgi:hypothetical protein
MWTLGASVAGALLLNTWVGFRRGIISPQFAVLGFYTYLAFGPVVGILTGYEVYRGVVLQRAPEAVLVMLIACTSLACGLMTRERRVSEAPFVHLGTPIAVVMSAAGVTYALWTISIAPVTAWTASKSATVASSAGDFHYQFLLAQLIVMCTFRAIRPGLSRAMFAANATCYVAYCLCFGERDFLIVGIAVLAFAACRSRAEISSGRFLTIAVVVLTASTAIATIRGGDPFEDTTPVASRFLNEGSLLFVNSVVLEWNALEGTRLEGSSYALAIRNVIWPANNAKADGLLEWFKARYAPGSGSGYGFALDAEAYLNFGLPGVVVVFFGLGVTIALLAGAARQSAFALSIATFITASVMYGFRNDSLTLMKAVAVGAGVHLFLFSATTFWWQFERQLMVSHGTVRLPAPHDARVP